MIGSSNREYVSLVHETTTRGGDHTRADGYISNDSTTNLWWQFLLTLPTNRGGKKLYIDAQKVIVAKAGLSDYVNTANVYGGVYTGTTLLNTDTQNRTAPGSYVDSFTAVDCSSYDFIVGYINTVVGTATNLSLRMSLRCYYD